MGSPPPTRGTQQRGLSRATTGRITPAYAGNTNLSIFSCPYSRDHPRLRGEHISYQPFANTLIGSPPPTRGTLMQSDIQQRKARITPAYAGNTNKIQCYKIKWRDHPRLRGEHALKKRQTTSVRGSPPPTRGTPVKLFLNLFFPGITPAYAGNTRLPKPYSQILGDHPRLRGEHSLSPPYLSL